MNLIHTPTEETLDKEIAMPSTVPAETTDAAEPDLTYYLTRRISEIPKRRWPGRVRDAHFGHPTVAELTELHSGLGAGIRRQILRGAPVHRRLPWVVRQVPWIVAILDCVVLLSFCGDVFNVYLLSPGEAPLAALAAVMLAVLGSGVGYTWLAMTGLRLKAFRTELGEIAWSAIGALTLLMLAVSGVLLGALALLMYERVTTEVLAQVDGSTGSAASMLGAIFAVLSLVANLSVIAVHALDGSWAMGELERAGRLLHRYEQLAGARPSAAPQAEVVVPLQRS
jgi:hypothetical protein